MDKLKLDLKGEIARQLATTPHGIILPLVRNPYHLAIAKEFS